MKEQQKSLPYSYEAEVVAAWREQLAEAAENPWLASVLLEHGERILRRFVHFYQQLRSLSRRARRHIQRKLALGLGAAALLLALSSIQAPLAFADTITVDESSCTLADAITAANNGGTVEGCTGSAGPDMLDITNAITLTAALPAITTEITIEGNGHTIVRDSDAATQFRILSVTTGDLTLNEATISGGVTNSSGGGIYSTGTLTVTNSTISGNSSSQKGGGIYNLQGTLTVQDSTISGNTADSGGGIYNDGTLTVTNSTISGNSATDALGGSGGGVYNVSGALTITNSTISGNTASLQGGGVYNYDGTVNIQNTIVAGNTGGNCSGTITSGGYNIESDTSSCGFTGTGDQQNVSSGNLNLGTLQDNDGPTYTHALLTGSAAIDKITDGVNGCVAGTSVDQRGAPRVLVNGPGVCDVGAYEYGSDPPTAVTLASFGAETVPADKVELLALRLRSGRAPWMGLAGLVATAVAALAARLRRSG